MPTDQFIVYILAPLGAYFLGAIPFALVIGKAHGVDIRKVGSGNIGATNLGRTLGMKYFWQAFVLDALKGFLPVFAMSFYVAHVNSGPSHLPSWSPLLAGVAAMLGHVFPIYLKFRGGKGVATAFGLVLGLWPLYTVAGLLAGLTFVVIFMAFRYISLGSVLSAIAFTVYVYLLGNSNVPPLQTQPDQLHPLVYVAAAFAVLITLKHRSNIARLLKGTEPKWGQRSGGGR